MEIRKEDNTDSKIYMKVGELYHKYNFFNKSTEGITLRVFHNHKIYFGYEGENFVGAMMIVENGFINKMECDIIIEKKYRGNGYAGQFLEFSENIDLPLELTHKTTISNMGMQRVFEKKGYEEVSRDDVAINYEKTKEKSKKRKENIMIKNLKMK